MKNIVEHNTCHRIFHKISCNIQKKISETLLDMSLQIKKLEKEKQTIKLMNEKQLKNKKNRINLEKGKSSNWKVISGFASFIKITSLLTWGKT